MRMADLSKGRKLFMAVLCAVVAVICWICGYVVVLQKQEPSLIATFFIMGTIAACFAIGMWRMWNRDPGTHVDPD
jgi:hypothetical protein